MSIRFWSYRYNWFSFVKYREIITQKWLKPTSWVHFVRHSRMFVIIECVITVITAKRCLGCRQIWNSYLFIDVLLHRAPKFVFFNQLMVPPIFLKDLRGAASQKRLKNTAIVGCWWIKFVKQEKNEFMSKQKKVWNEKFEFVGIINLAIY